MHRIWMDRRLREPVDNVPSGGAPAQPEALRSPEPWDPIKWEDAESEEDAAKRLAELTARVKEIHGRDHSTAEYLNEITKRVEQMEKFRREHTVKRESAVPPSLRMAMAEVKAQADDERGYNPLERLQLAKVDEREAGYDKLLAFKRAADSYSLLAAVWPRLAISEGGRRSVKDTPIAKEYERLGRELLAGVGLSPESRAWDTINDPDGGYMVPNLVSTTFSPKAEKVTGVHRLVMQYAMEGKDVKVNRLDERATSYLAPENTDDVGTAVQMSTAQIGSTNLIAVDEGAATALSFNITQDGIPSALAIAQEDLTRAFFNGRNSACINGDTNGADATGHQDYVVSSTNKSAVTLDIDIRRAWDGLRKLCIAAGANASLDLGGNSPTGEQIAGGFGAMGPFGTNPREEVIAVSSFKGAASLLLMKDGAGNPLTQTVDVYGPTAPVLTGQLAWLMGAPLMSDSFFWQNLNASGVYDETTTDLTGLVLYNRMGFIFGERQGVRVVMSTEVLLPARQIYLQGDARSDFKERYPVDTADEATAYYFYNMPLVTTYP